MKKPSQQRCPWAGNDLSFRYHDEEWGVPVHGDWLLFELLKVLKKRGFRFVGSTICYAFMQAVGMVNDHLVACLRQQGVMLVGKRRRIRKGLAFCADRIDIKFGYR